MAIFVESPALDGRYGALLQFFDRFLQVFAHLLGYFGSGCVIINFQCIFKCHYLFRGISANVYGRGRDISYFIV